MDVFVEMLVIEICRRMCNVFTLEGVCDCDNVICMQEKSYMSLNHFARREVRIECEERKAKGEVRYGSSVTVRR